MDILKPNQRDYIIKVAQSAEVVSSLEERINHVRRKYMLLSILFTFIIIPAAFGVFIMINYKANDSFVEFWTSYFGVYVILAAGVSAISRFCPEYRAFSALADCMSKVDACDHQFPCWLESWFP